MKVMVIVKASKGSEAGEMPSTELLAAMTKYNEELANAGIVLALDGLHPSSKGVRIRFSGKNRTVTDGPFAETRELIAGFWLWRVKSMQEAVEWVKKCPNPMKEDSDIEIRRVFEAEDFGAEFTPELREQEAAVGAKMLGLNAPTFKESPELLVGGLSRHYTAETRTGISKLWEQAVPLAAAVPGMMERTFFGVCWNGAADCSFDYLAGAEVFATDKLPPEFTTLKLDARRYAVFPHTGHLSELPKTIDTIWTNWVPNCGLKVARGAPCFERYNSEFNPHTGLGGMELWVPLDS
jgi:predicted transcriptional regulator YdeE